MAEIKYIDLKITDDDLALDSDGTPLTVSDKVSIVQDLCHAIRESGYAVNMIGERNRDMRRLLQQKILEVVENDTRIIPGTANFYEDTVNFVNGVGKYTIIADTYEYGQAQVGIESQGTQLKKLKVKSL